MGKDDSLGSRPDPDTGSHDIRKVHHGGTTVKTLDHAPATWPAHRLEAQIRSGRLSSRELLEIYIERIETLDRRLNSVVTMDLDSARAAAEAADVAAARREWLGPLHGLPVTIKDAIEVRD